MGALQEYVERRKSAVLFEQDQAIQYTVSSHGAQRRHADVRHQRSHRRNHYCELSFGDDEVLADYNVDDYSDDDVANTIAKKVKEKTNAL